MIPKISVVMSWVSSTSGILEHLELTDFPISGVSVRDKFGFLQDTISLNFHGLDLQENFPPGAQLTLELVGEEITKKFGRYYIKRLKSDEIYSEKDTVYRIYGITGIRTHNYHLNRAILSDTASSQIYDLLNTLPQTDIAKFLEIVWLANNVGKSRSDYIEWISQKILKSKDYEKTVKILESYGFRVRLVANTWQNRENRFLRIGENMGLEFNEVLEFKNVYSPLIPVIQPVLPIVYSRQINYATEEDSIPIYPEKITKIREDIELSPENVGKTLRFFGYYATPSLEDERIIEKTRFDANIQSIFQSEGDFSRFVTHHEPPDDSSDVLATLPSSPEDDSDDLYLWTYDEYTRSKFNPLTLDPNRGSPIRLKGVYETRAELLMAFYLTRYKIRESGEKLTTIIPLNLNIDVGSTVINRFDTLHPILVTEINHSVDVGKGASTMLSGVRRL